MSKIMKNVPFYVISFGIGFLLGSVIFKAFRIDKMAGYVVIAACLILIGVSWIINRIVSQHAKSEA